MKAFQLKKEMLFLTFSYLLLFSQNWTVSAKLCFCYLYNRKSLKSQIWNAQQCSPQCSGIQQIWKTIVVKSDYHFFYFNSVYRRKILRQRSLSLQNSGKTNRKSSRKLHIIEICCSYNYILMPASFVQRSQNTVLY